MAHLRGDRAAAEAFATSHRRARRLYRSPELGLVAPCGERGATLRLDRALRGALELEAAASLEYARSHLAPRLAGAAAPKLRVVDPAMASHAAAALGEAMRPRHLRQLIRAALGIRAGDDGAVPERRGEVELATRADSPDDARPVHGDWMCIAAASGVAALTILDRATDELYAADDLAYAHRNEPGMPAPVFAARECAPHRPSSRTPPPIATGPAQVWDGDQYGI